MVPKKTTEVWLNALVHNHYCNYLKFTQTFRSAAVSITTNNVEHF